MKKILLVIGILLILGLVVSGCAVQQKDVKQVKKEAPKSVEQPAEPKDVAEESEPEVVEKTVETKTKSEPEETPKPTISQDDLDQLKKDLDNLEFENVEGFSE